MVDLDRILDDARHADVFTKSGSPMYRRVHSVENPPSQLTLVIGGNASGKSLFRREIQRSSEASKVEVHHLSMEARSQDPWIRAEAYGDEEAMSTGMISLSSMLRLLRASKEASTPHILFWDEPDVGLSDEVAAGVALEILQFLWSQPKHLVGFFIVSHRRSLIEALDAATPRIVFIGKNAPKSLGAWLQRKVTPVRPQDVIDEGVRRWLAVNDFFEKKH